MTSKFNIRWLIAGFVWLLALGLTFWNCSRIDAVAAARESNEKARKEINFQRQNASKLAQVLISREALFLAVPSVHLGLISAKSRIEALSAAFDLKDATLRFEAPQADKTSIPCQLTLRGSFESFVRFFSAFQKYPYLPVRNTHIKISQDTGEAVAEMAFAFQYKIQAPAEKSEVPARNIRHQPTPGVNPL